MPFIRPQNVYLLSRGIFFLRNDDNNNNVSSKMVRNINILAKVYKCTLSRLNFNKRLKKTKHINIKAKIILKKLSTVTQSLSRKVAARNEFDKAIKQGEIMVKNLLETYKNITDVLKTKFPVK